MGVDLNTYRRRIGAHASRARRARSEPKGTPARGNSNDFSCIGLPKEYDTTCTCHPWFLRSGAHARKGLLVLVLYVTLIMVSVTQPRSSLQNLHNLAGRILMDGDVERQPGPTDSEKSDTGMPGELPGAPEQILIEENTLAAKWEQRFVELEDRMQKRVDLIEAELQRHKNIIKEITRLGEQDCQRSSENREDTRRELDTLGTKLDTLASDALSRIQINEDQADKSESASKRNNIKLFGVHEEAHEPYWDCIQLVLQIFREAVPGVPWTEKDVVRVQRMGAARGGYRSTPRPILVEMSTFLDKLTLLRYGRTVMRSRGIRMAGDLTTRQMKILNDLREQGHQAYYRNNKLWFRDAGRDERLGNRPHTYTTRRRAPKREGFLERRGAGRERQNPAEVQRQPQHQTRLQGTDDAGTWAHPDHLQGTLRRHETSSINRGHPCYLDPSGHHSDLPTESSVYLEREDESDFPQTNKQTRLCRKPPQDEADNGVGGWQRLTAALIPRKGIRPPVPDDRATCHRTNRHREATSVEHENVLDAHQDPGRILSSRESSISDRSMELAQSPEEAMETPSADILPPNQEIMDEAAVRQIQQNQGATDSSMRKKTQKTVLDWLTNSSEAAGTGATEEVDLNCDNVQTGSRQDRRQTSSSVPSSVWQGRLRNNSASPLGVQNETQT